MKQTNLNTRDAKIIVWFGQTNTGNLGGEQGRFVRLLATLAHGLWPPCVPFGQLHRSLYVCVRLVSWPFVAIWSDFLVVRVSISLFF